MMNFTNILPQRFNNKRFEDYNITMITAWNQTHSVSSTCKHMITVCGVDGNNFTLTTMHTCIPKFVYVII